MHLKYIALASLVALAPCLAAADGTSISGLRFIGAQTVANTFQVGGTTVGGLSGLDYDPATGLWYAISDDKSDINPARFYALKLTYGASQFTSVDFVDVVSLRQPNGDLFPNTKTGGEVPDPEAIRVDPRSGYLWWTSEGDRRLGLPPFVRIMDKQGRHLASEPALPIFAMNKDKELGPRHNNSYEGLSFSADGRSVWIGMESALYEDGPISTVEAGALARFTEIDRNGKVLRQVAYPVDPIQARPGGKNGDNGVSEILALDKDRLLVIERSGVEGADGVWKMYIRVYEANLAGATDVSGTASLKGAEARPVAKRLILDLSKAPELGFIDNIECVTFGPSLPNGHRTLVLASDNNFNASQITQFLAFEVLP